MVSNNSIESQANTRSEFPKSPPWYSRVWNNLFGEQGSLERTALENHIEDAQLAWESDPTKVYVIISIDRWGKLDARTRSCHVVEPEQVASLTRVYRTVGADVANADVSEVSTLYTNAPNKA